MVDKNLDPVSFSILLDNLSDAKEHIGDLIKSVQNTEDYSEVELAIELGHVYAHMNRAWNNRDLTDDSLEFDWDKASDFPKDIRPVG